MTFISQTAKLGGTEEHRSQFRAHYGAYYTDTIALLLAERQPAHAFHVLERSRARSMLTMLAERDLVFATDLSPEMQQTRRRNAAEYDRVQGKLAQLNPSKDGAQVQTLQTRLRELITDREDLAEQIRQTSPRLAALQYPQPLDLAATWPTLDPGTVLLSYSVGPEQTVLFVVQPTGSKPDIQVFHITVSEAALRQQVQEFRQFAQQRSVISSAALQRRGQALYDLLLKPAELQLTASECLLIVPDGPLHTLPFAALQRGSQYLIEWKLLHTALSATVYAELKKLADPLLCAGPWNSQLSELRIIPKPTAKQQLRVTAQSYIPCRIAASISVRCLLAGRKCGISVLYFRSTTKSFLIPQRLRNKRKP